ncbi:MAG: hypothetical protein IKT27_03045 [Clostridia bacterium]|nr:hypothetical protein [Clostridia bacterium]
MASKKVIVELLGSIKTIYSYYGKDADLELLINTWYSLLYNYTDDEVKQGMFLALRVCKYAPTPADIIEQIENLKQIEKPSEQELWGLYRQALQEANYYSYRLNYNYIDSTGISQGEQARIAIEALWEGLPQELKIYLGDKSELMRNARELNEADISYEKNRFSKTFPILQKRIEDKKLFLAMNDTFLKINSGQ